MPVTESYEFITNVKDTAGRVTHQVTTLILPPGSPEPEDARLFIEYDELTYVDKVTPVAETNENKTEGDNDNGENPR